MRKSSISPMEKSRLSALPSLKGEERGKTEEEEKLDAISGSPLRKSWTVLEFKS